MSWITELRDDGPEGDPVPANCFCAHCMTQGLEEQTNDCLYYRRTP